CLKNGISDSADGITRDWPFFPAHMDRVIDRFRVLYGHFGIKYHTPVLHFDIDKPMTYIDKIKGGAGAVPDETANTTGRLLHRLGLSDRDNYKGTELDKKVQARCFQFVLPNIYIYWIFRGNERWDQYESAVLDYFGKRIEDSKILIERFFEKGEKRELFAFLDEPGVLT
ncbi:MAG: hypothetical protein FJ088_08145, partial [Deltaproteobacteria bacterium]|nr:hypothetical protein [Deltaproteobacteria bacterium]